MYIHIKNAAGLLKQAFSEFNQDKCFHLAAALSYYTIFSLAPMLIIVISVASLFLGNETVQTAIYGQMQDLVGRQGADSVQSLIQNSYKPRTSILMTMVGIGALIAGATTVFIQIQDSLNIIWSVKPKPRRGFLKMMRDRLLSFGMILGVGFLLLVSLLLSAGLSIVGNFMTQRVAQFAIFFKVLEVAVSFILNAVLFGALFKFLPDAKIKWHDVRIGGLLTSAMFAVGKVVIGLYLGNSHIASAYGAAGAIIIVILWVNYSSLILFFGAELTQVYATKYGSSILPADYAVRVVKTEQEVGA
jgi:membrane protein